MNAKLMLNEVHGRTVLPAGIIFLWFSTTLLFLLFPQGRHLLVAMDTSQYSWMWAVPLISGAYLGVSILVLEVHSK